MLFSTFQCISGCCTMSDYLNKRINNHLGKGNDTLTKTDSHLQLPMCMTARLTWTRNQVINTETTGLPLLVVIVAGFNRIPRTITNIHKFITCIVRNCLHWKYRIVLYKYWLVNRSTLKNYAPKLCNVARGNITQLVLLYHGKEDLLHSALSLTGIFKLVIHNFEKHVFQFFANDYIIFVFISSFKYVKYKRKRLFKPS